MHPKDACLNLDLGSLSLDQHLGVFVMFLEQFLSCFCAVTECEAGADREDRRCEGRYVVDNKAQVVVCVKVTSTGMAGLRVFGSYR